MKRTVEELKIRIHQLEERDPVTNKYIINKLKRKVRAVEGR